MPVHAARAAGPMSPGEGSGAPGGPGGGSRTPWPAAHQPRDKVEAEITSIISKPWATGGRTKARRMTTELTGNQPQLYEIFGLNHWTPRS